MIRCCAKILKPVLNVFDFLTPLGDLVVRIYIALIFFRAGLVKIQAWQSTMALFENEYHVPFLPASWAAVIGTGAEILLPILLVLGFGGRIMIFIFFVYNAVAVISYPHLWTPEGAVGLEQHILWGLLLMMLMFHGPGKLSIDYWLRKKYKHLVEE